jgi:hypothetical protein
MKENSFEIPGISKEEMEKARIEGKEENIIREKETEQYHENFKGADLHEALNLKIQNDGEIEKVKNEILEGLEK